jgi:hypothetical protein
MSTATEALGALNRLLHDTVNSVVQYTEISSPYIPPDFAEQAAAMQAIADEEKVLANEAVDLIGRRDGVPEVGIFPYWNVDLNYLDLRYMAKFAAEHQRKAIAHLEAELPKLDADPEVASFLRRALDQKKAHLEKLEEIKGDYGES